MKSFQLKSLGTSLPDLLFPVFRRFTPEGESATYLKGLQISVQERHKGRKTK